MKTASSDFENVGNMLFSNPQMVFDPYLMNIDEILGKTILGENKLRVFVFTTKYDFHQLSRNVLHILSV